MASKGSAFQGDTQLFNSLTIAQSGTADFGGEVIRNVGAGIVTTDAVNVGQVQGLISQGTSNWAQYAANSTVNIAGNNVYSTVNQTFISGANSFTVNWITLSNISTQAAAGAAGSPAVWSQYPALMDVNMAASTLKSTIGVTFINTGLTSTATFGFNDYYYLSTSVSTLVANGGSADISTLSSFVNTISTSAGSNISTLSSFVNTISTSAGSNFSTLSNATAAGLSTNTMTRKFAATAEITPGTTSAGLIVSTYISTLGLLNVFQNTGSASLNLELNLSTLGIWPNTAYEVMRFAHYGQPGTQSSVILYTENSNYAAGILAEMAPGDTISFIYKGGAPLINNNRISTTQYYRVTGY
jgi:hypothetical protein